MKILRYTLNGSDWRLGVQVSQGIVPLSVPDLPTLVRAGAEGLKQVREQVDSPSELVDLSNVTLGAPIVNPPKFICIGLNYLEHAKETNVEPPKAPVVFSKFNSAIIGPEEAIRIPPVTEKVDYEVELGVVIGRGGRNIPAAEALEHVFGYTIVNDVSARDLQKMDSQWLKGKTLDTFAPIGPVVVTSDAIQDPQQLRITMKRNGAIVQDATTNDMIFSVREIIHYLSTLFTLEPGDIIATGTPHGVIMGQKNPRWLQPGEILEAGIEKIGVLRNPIVAD